MSSFSETFIHGFGHYDHMSMFSHPSLRKAGQFLMAISAIVLLASCGGGGGAPNIGSQVTSPQPDTQNAVSSINLIFSSPDLPSAGAAGTEVTVTALLKTAANTPVVSTAIKFSASSGVLSNVDASSDKNGQAKASLGTSGDKTNRTITVTVTAGGKTASGTVNVTGTKLSAVGPATLASGGSGEFTLTLLDSDNKPIANAPVSLASQNGNSIAIKSSGGGTSAAPLTNSLGQVVAVVTVSKAGNDVLRASALGVSTSTAFSVNAANLSMAAYYTTGGPALVANTRSCVRIGGRYEVSGVAQTGTINLSTSRGRLYQDENCTIQLANSAVALVNGDFTPVYVSSTTAGIATLTAAAAGGLTASTELEIIAPLVDSATLSMQADPATLGTNTGSNKTEFSTITAIVRDGTADNNLVKGANVEFTLVNDVSGGSLSSPTLVQTGSNGSASVKFFAGSVDTPLDGVRVEARVQGTSIQSSTALTVGKKAVFITAGTGNSLAMTESGLYQKDFQVFVTDAAGNPVPGVAITATVQPTHYLKGSYSWVTASGAVPAYWTTLVYATCPNEDSAPQNGILDPGEDLNGNGRLDPGMPATISVGGVTGANGVTVASLIYPKDRANWVMLKLNFRASVSGTESQYTTAAFTLPVLSSDITNQSVTPPGYVSPYGVKACTQPN